MGCGGSKAAADDAAGEPGAKASAGREFSVKGKELSQLPEVPKDSEALDCSENKLIALPPSIGELGSLTKLDCSDNKLTVLPPELGACAKLEDLLVYKNELKEVPKELGALGALKVLNLFNNKIKKLPNELGALSCLDEVNVSGNKLMMVADAPMANWSSVTNLQLSGNNLVKLGSLEAMTAIAEIRLYDNNLEEMPKLPAHCAALSIIEIHKNRIASIADEYFAAAPALSRLTINNNLLTSLPALLLSAPLVNLQVQENKLTSLPSGEWPKTLGTLFLQDNTELATLPASLGDISDLKRCNVAKLPLDEASLPVMEKMKMICLKADGGMFWDAKGRKMEM